MSKKSALVIIDVQVNVVKDAYNRDRFSRTWRAQLRCRLKDPLA